MRKMPNLGRPKALAALLATLLALVLGGALAQDAQNGGGDVADPDEPVIQLGQDDVVTAEEYQQEFERAMRSLAAQQGLPYTEETRRLFDRFRVDFLNQLATEEALLREAEERGIEVSDEEVQTQIDQARENAGGDPAFEEALQEFGYDSVDAYREAVREGLAAQRVVDELRSGIEVSDEEVQRFYQQNQDRFGGAAVEEVRDAIETQLQNEDLSQRFSDLQERYGIETFPDRVAIDEPAISRGDLEPNEPGQDADPEADFGDEEGVTGDGTDDDASDDATTDEETSDAP